jgi:anti-sigma factor ChrR (cupin superfamily)
MGSVGVEPPLISFGEPESLAPGLEIETVAGVSGLGEAVYRVRAGPGLSLPQHQPGPAVEILVLEGEFEGDGVVYGPGDYLSLEESPKQRLISGPARGCLYLKATHVPMGLPAD